ncbi:MAG: (d)CMP kinase [Bacteroidales bacterium]|nr:(d)CMP kinase [Bacteroidales bacterium]MCF8456125.1 (d)CMP kinase [Bacteroidales bacterium]
MNKFDRDIIIAIDGFSSCGKSTLAKEVAQKLNYKYIDSGAMYRAVTLLAINHDLIEGVQIDEERLLNLLNKVSIDFRYNAKKNKQETYLNNNNVEDEIRDIEVSDHVSIISKVKIVRECMVDQQRKMGLDKRIVMDGRDIGTVVFPNAELKIFMTASEEVRAKRRYDEIKAMGKEVLLKDVSTNIQKRDMIDQNREESPLRKATDAIVLDNSKMNRQEQLEWVLKILSEKFGYSFT